MPRQVDKEDIGESAYSEHVYVRLTLGTTARSLPGLEVKVSNLATEEEIESTIEKAQDAFFSLRKAYGRLEIEVGEGE